MKKLGLVGLAVVLLGAVLGGAAQADRASAKPTKRVVEVRYAGVNNVSINGVGTGLCPIDVFDPTEICISVPLELNDRYVKAEFIDASGQKVDASLMHGIGDTYTSFGEFCGAHKKPVAIPGAGGYLQIFYSVGTCADGTPSVATTGTIVFTFSTKP